MLAALSRIRDSVSRSSLLIRSIRFGARASQGQGGVETAPGIEWLTHGLGIGEHLVFLTSSRSHFDEALQAGIDAYHIGESVPPEHKGLVFADVPRIIEEKLRIPTARPLSPAGRTGGLLAIPAGGRKLYLEAVAEDTAADWVLIGGELILYTEQPDLEDRLAELPGARSLSYAVHKEALVVEPAAAGEPALYEGHGYRVREGPGDELYRWARMRRRSLPPAKLQLRLDPDVYLTALNRAPPQSELLTLLREIAGPEAAPDYVRYNGERAAVTWMTPYATEDSEELLAFIHSPDTLSRSVPHAFALAETVKRSSAPGALHCLVLNDAAFPGLLAAALYPDERNRLNKVVYLGDADRIDVPHVRIRPPEGETASRAAVSSYLEQMARMIAD